MNVNSFAHHFIHRSLVHYIIVSMRVSLSVPGFYDKLHILGAVSPSRNDFCKKKKKKLVHKIFRLKA